jgi:2-keto-3-deoxy-L-rhamnonate aldolase RhmA
MRVCSPTLRERVNRRDLLVFACIHESRSPAVVELYQDAGYDAIMIDREHVTLDRETVREHIRVARILDMPIMVRVAEDCYHELNRLLDQAPDGVFIPRIRSREQVEAIMQMVKYAPLGKRGLAGSTCPVGKYYGWSSVTEQIETVNRNLVVGIQIETAEALADLDGILSVPGVDMAVVGNDDLSMSMGIPGQWDHPDYVAAVERIIAACERHNVLPGIAGGDPDFAAGWTKKGMKVLWYVSDIYLIWDGAVRQLSALKSRLP